MFKKYQGGSHVMVLSAQGKDPRAHCRLTGSVSLRYDKGVRGYVHVLEGDSITTRIQLPANDRTSLGLEQSFLILQAAVQRDARFTVEFVLQGGKGGRRRINFSSSVKEPSISTLIARVPFVTQATGEWCNYCFDLSSLMAELFPSNTYKSLESLVVGGACLLRRVFTMRERPRGSNELVNEDGAWDIPQACQMTIKHTPIPTHMMSPVFPDHQRTTVSHSGRRSVPQSSGHPPTHVAFGEKVAIPDHILARQATSRSAGNVRKKAEPQSLGMELRQSSAPIVVRGGRGVAKVKGAGPGSGRSHTQSKKLDAEKRGRVEEGDPLDRDELLLALNVLGVQRLGMREGGTKMSGRGITATDSGLRSGRECKSDMEPGLADVEPDTSYLDSSGGEVEEETGGERGEERMRDGGSGKEQLFSYFSPPKSAALEHTTSGEAGSSVRDVELNQDFMLHSATAVNELGLPHHRADQSDLSSETSSAASSEEGGRIDDDVMGKGIPLASGLAEDELNQTRLSDDYDWRQYASREDTPLSPSSPHTLLHLPTYHHGNSTTPEPDTSTLSMIDKPAAHSLLDTLDTRGMGGALSPELQDGPVLADQSNGSDEELELMYDPQLRCFFDPQTHKYYELIQ